MKGFIEIEADCVKRLVNIRHIEEVVEFDKNSCYIYLAHNCPDAIEQDYYLVDESYESIKAKIEKAYE